MAFVEIQQSFEDRNLAVLIVETKHQRFELGLWTARDPTLQLIAHDLEEALQTEHKEDYVLREEYEAIEEERDDLQKGYAALEQALGDLIEVALKANEQLDALAEFLREENDGSPSMEATSKGIDGIRDQLANAVLAAKDKRDES
jgi:uncharacterized membrane protein YccC